MLQAKVEHLEERLTRKDHVIAVLSEETELPVTHIVRWPEHQHRRGLSMARNTDELLSALKGFLPVECHPLLPILAGVAATQFSVEGAAEDMGAACFLDQAGRTDLELHGAALGCSAGRGSEESFRVRLCRPQEAVAPDAILKPVNAILEECGAGGNASTFEWFAPPGPRIPRPRTAQPRLARLHLRDSALGTVGRGSAFLDVDAYLDTDTYLGIDDDHPSVAAVAAEVYRLKAAGPRWWRC